MAERTEGSTTIDATPAKVLEVIVDFDAYPRWAGVKTAEVRKKDSKGRPSEVAMSVSQMGFEAKYTLAYRYAPRSGGLSWTTVEASGAVRDVEGEYALEPADEGRTRVVYRLAIDLGIALPSFIRKRAEKMIIDTALNGLKDEVERRG